MLYEIIITILIYPHYFENYKETQNMIYLSGTVSEVDNRKKISELKIFTHRIKHTHHGIIHKISTLHGSFRI